MPLDAICLGAVADELNRFIAGSRIDRINQPEKDEILIMLRTDPGTQKLLISANQNSARIHLTKALKENPSSPPMFCMLLRKYLTNGRIIEISQPMLERVVEIKLVSNDELGVSAEKKLVCELMGRYSNIILTASDGRIIDCLIKVDSEMSEKRQVLPGLFYRYPPEQDKISAQSLTYEKIINAVNSAEDSERADKWILKYISGISPLIAREIVYRAYGTDSASIGENKRSTFADSIWDICKKYSDKQFEPWLLAEKTDGKPKDFSFMEIKQYGDIYVSERKSNFSLLLDSFYSERERLFSLSQKYADIKRLVDRTYEKILKKTEIQKEELQKTFVREELRKKADILGAFTNMIPRGVNKVNLPDLYSEDNSEIEIELSEKLTPQQNIRKYYKDYTRLKNAEITLKEQISIGYKEMEYLQSVADEITRAENQSDINEIREELAESGYIKKQDKKTNKNSKNSAKKKPAIKPLVFSSPSGFAVLVGKNNKQNDILTLHEAGKNDMWFHAGKIPGSHVILITEGKEVPPADMEFAASLAAGFSKASGSEKVAVDYTPVKYIKKPNGSKPGMVIYERYNTAFIKPYNINK